MNIRTYTIIYIGALGLFLFQLPSSVVAKAAETTIRVSPIILTVPLSPGKINMQEITVENMTSTAVPLKATLNDFETTGEEGGYTFESTHTSPLLSWTRINQTELLLKPKEKKKILLTIKTPSSIPLGGYYGMIFFQPITQPTKTTTQVQSKIGVLLLANIGVPDPKAKKADILTFTTNVLPTESTLPILLRVKNISLHFFTAKPIVTITPLLPLLSMDSKPIYLEEKIIFQNKIRRWNQDIPLPDLSPKIYKAQMSVSTGNGQYVTAEKYFLIFPFAKVAMVSLLILLVLFLLLKRKRLKKTLHALLSK